MSPSEAHAQISRCAFSSTTSCLLGSSSCNVCRHLPPPPPLLTPSMACLGLSHVEVSSSYTLPVISSGGSPRSNGIVVSLVALFHHCGLWLPFFKWFGLVVASSCRLCPCILCWLFSHVCHAGCFSLRSHDCDACWLRLRFLHHRR